MKPGDSSTMIARQVHARFDAHYPVLYRQLMSVGLLGTVYRFRRDALVVHGALEMTLPRPGPLRRYRGLMARVMAQLQHPPTPQGLDAARRVVAALWVGLPPGEADAPLARGNGGRQPLH